jgi:transketolase
VLDRTAYPAAENLTRGAYILRDAKEGRPDLILISTGSEVHIALEAAKRIDESGVKVRVVNMPSWELFDRQDEAYRHRVLPPEIKARVAIEAGISQGWHRYVGDEGRIIALDRFGASAPSKILYEKFGFTPENVVETALTLVKRPG